MRQMTKRVMCFLIAVAVTMGLSAGTIVFADEIAATISDADFGTIPSDYTFEDYIINPVITNTGTEKLDLTGVDIKVELTDGDPSAFLCGWKSVGGYLLPGDTATNAWIIVKEGLPTGVTTSTLTLSYKVNGSWKVLATSKVSVRVNPAEYGFTSFPKSGTCEKTSEYSFSWGLKKEPDYIVLQRKDSDGAWGNLNDLKGKTSFSVKYLGHETDTYRIIVISNSETFCSNEFTVTWIDPLTYEATLENLGFGSKVVGYSDISSVIFRIDITGTGNLICDSDHYKILFTGDTSAFEWWVAPGSTMFSGNMYNAGTVKPVKGLSKGSYKLTAHLYYDQDGTGTAYGWKELDSADYTFKVTAATPTPTKKPTATPTKKPTATPTKKPTATPTKKPTAKPTKKPTATPTKKPTATPTKKPTAKPTKKPTATPTKKPTAKPTKKPTATPTKKPTATPTKKPTATPMPKTKWVKEGNNWYYYDSNGKKATGWVKDGSNWYYCDKNGVMQIGWVQDGDKWYYMGPSGAMAIGWVQTGGKWYYMGPSGAMATGWVQSGSTWYYMNSSGAMVTGWQKVGDKWYYFNSNGAMQTKWLQIGDKWYFLHPETGAMMTGKVIINGVKYLFDDSGALIGTYD
ncbi:MAG: hypothetical protein K5779_08380 [Saccharofermentans sp.]|nr:hypothetical protein [Saccharofermentans sp.]